MGMDEVRKTEPECQLGHISNDPADVMQRASSRKHLRKEKSSKIRSKMLTTAPQYIMETVEKPEKQEVGSYAPQNIYPRKGIIELQEHKEKTTPKDTGRTMGLKAKTQKRITRDHPTEAFVSNDSSSAIGPNREGKTRSIIMSSPGPTPMSHSQDESAGIQSKQMGKKGFRAIPPGDTQLPRTKEIVDTISDHAESSCSVGKGITPKNRSPVEEGPSQKTSGKKLGDISISGDSMKSRRSLYTTMEDKRSTFSIGGRRNISTQRSTSNSVQEIRETSSFELNTNIETNAVSNGSPLIGPGPRETTTTRPSSIKYEASTLQTDREIGSRPGVGHYLDISRRPLCNFEIETERKGNKFLRIFEVRILAELSLDNLLI